MRGLKVAVGVLCLTWLSCKGEDTSQCSIDKQTIDAGVLNPSNACQVCVPSEKQTAYTALPDGVTCGTGKVCSAATCTDGCFINAALVMPGTVDPSNECKTCAPTNKVDGYVAKPDGTSCSNGRLCSAGMCQDGCFINGALIAAGTVDPTNPCRSCQPMVSNTAYSPKSNGTQCGAGSICINASCTMGCFIDGGLVVSGAADPATTCRSCQPTVNLNDYTTFPQGSSCAVGSVCNGTQCVNSCFIAGAIVDAGTFGADQCHQCIPATSTTRYSAVPVGTKCSACNSCNASGACGPTVLVASVPGNVVPNSIVLTQDSLYWLNNRRDPCCNSDISRISKDGGAYNVVVPGLYSPNALMLFNDQFFISDSQANQLRRAEADGGLAPDGGTFVTMGFAYAASGLTNDGNRVYWTGRGTPGGSQSSVNSTFPDGGGFISYLSNSGGPAALATDGTSLFWVDAVNRTIMRSPIVAMPPASMAMSLGPTYGDPRTVRIFDNTLYWATGDGGVFSMPKTGGTATMLANGLRDPVDLAYDGLNVYAANYNNGFGGAGFGSVERIPLDGGVSAPIYNGEAIRSVAVDNQCVYFTTYAGTLLRKIDK